MPKLELESTKTFYSLDHYTPLRYATLGAGNYIIESLDSLFDLRYLRYPKNPAIETSKRPEPTISAVLALSLLSVGTLFGEVYPPKPDGSGETKPNPSRLISVVAPATSPLDDPTSPMTTLEAGDLTLGLPVCAGRGVGVEVGVDPPAEGVGVGVFADTGEGGTYTEGEGVGLTTDGEGLGDASILA